MWTYKVNTELNAHSIKAHGVSTLIFSGSQHTRDASRQGMSGEFYFCLGRITLLQLPILHMNRQTHFEEDGKILHT